MRFRDMQPARAHSAIALTGARARLGMFLRASTVLSRGHDPLKTVKDLPSRKSHAQHVTAPIKVGEGEDLPWQSFSLLPTPSPPSLRALPWRGPLPF